MVLPTDQQDGHEHELGLCAGGFFSGLGVSVRTTHQMVIVPCPMIGSARHQAAQYKRLSGTCFFSFDKMVDYETA